MNTQKYETSVLLGVRRESRRRGWAHGVLLMDAAMVTAAAVAASVFATGAPIPLPYLTLFCVLTLAFFTVMRSYRHRFTIEILDDVVTCFGVSAVAAMMMTSLESFLSTQEVMAGNSVRLWCFAAVYLSAGRTGLLLAQKNSRRKGEGMEQTLIVGAGRVGSLVWDRLTEHPELGLAPIGFLDKDPIAGPETATTNDPCSGRVGISSGSYDSTTSSTSSSLSRAHHTPSCSTSWHGARTWGCGCRSFLGCSSACRLALMSRMSAACHSYTSGLEPARRSVCSQVRAG